MRRLMALSLFVLSFIVAPVVAAPLGTSPSSKVYPVDNVSKAVKGQAVDFTWKEDGKSVSFSEYTKGKVVLLNIWATWCGPCKKEIPDLIKISEEMSSKGVLVMGVSVDQHKNSLQLVSNYVEKTNITYHMFLSLKIAEAYGGIQAIPTSFIIDRNGKVTQKIVGMQSKAQFEQAIRAAM